MRNGSPLQRLREKVRLKPVMRGIDPLAVLPVPEVVEEYLEENPPTKGADGRDGLDGHHGRDGVPGADGRDGAQGLRGEPGPKGDKGEKGDRGETGATGAPGNPGGAIVSLPDVVLTETAAAAAIVAGVRKRTVACAGALVGDRLEVYPTAGAPNGYMIGDAACLVVGQIVVTLQAPLLAVLATYSIPCKVVAFR